MGSRVERVLLAALVLLMFVTVATILVSTRVTTSRAALTQMEQVMSRVSVTAAGESEGFLDPAEHVARLTSDLLADDVFTEVGAATEADRFEEYLRDQLRENGTIAGLFAGRPDGGFFYVSRNTDVAGAVTRTKVVRATAAGRDITLTYRDAEGTVVEVVSDPDDTYDPTTRPWYVAAAASRQPAWTAPYVFFTSRQPGITVAQAVRSPAGELQGVFGVDIEIRALSDILSGVAISDEGNAFIVDGDGQLVALRGARELGLDDGNEVRRLRADELDDPVTREAADALVAAGGPLVSAPVFERFVADGRRWRALFAPFADGRWPWTIAVFAPEDDFLEGVRSTQRANTSLAVAIGVVAAVLAAMILTGVTRPLARLRASVGTDVLTGVASRRRLLDEGARLVQRTLDAGEELAVAMVDIDHFKAVNDTYGHAVGDEVLAAVATRMGRALRATDLLARFGGEEFAIVLPETDAEVAETIAHRLRRAIAGAPVNTSAGPIPATISLGLVTLGAGARATLHELIEVADGHLYDAKRAGRDQVVVGAGRSAAR